VSRLGGCAPGPDARGLGILKGIVPLETEEDMSKRAEDSGKGDFKLGDHVKLTSGGPIMTTKEWEEFRHEWLCQWFSGSKLQEGYFVATSLVRVKPGEGEG